MVQYHNILGNIDQGWNDLERAANDFIRFINRYLPVVETHWAKRIYQEMEEPESIEELVSDVMFDQGMRPAEYAWEAARVIDERSLIHVGARDNLDFLDEHVENKDEAVIEKREEYIGYLFEVERVRRVGNWDQFELVRTVRNGLWNEEAVPTRVDFLQDLIDGQGQPAPELPSSNENPKETALSGFPSGHMLEEEMLREEAESDWAEKLGEEPNVLEAIAWAGILSMSMRGDDGGARAPGTVTVEVEGEEIQHDATVAFKN